VGGQTLLAIRVAQPKGGVRAVGLVGQAKGYPNGPPGRRGWGAPRGRRSILYGAAGRSAVKQLVGIQAHESPAFALESYCRSPVTAGASTLTLQHRSITSISHMALGWRRYAMGGFRGVDRAEPTTTRLRSHSRRRWQRAVQVLGVLLCMRGARAKDVHEQGLPPIYDADAPGHVREHPSPALLGNCLGASHRCLTRSRLALDLSPSPYQAARLQKRATMVCNGVQGQCCAVAFE